MAYLLGALVVVAVLAFVVLPLLRRQSERARAVEPTGPAEERAEIYRELVELELDQRVGKVTEADYRELSEALMARAAALIAEEESLSASVGEQVEREIAAMRESLRQSADVPAEEARS